MLNKTPKHSFNLNLIRISSFRWHPWKSTFSSRKPRRPTRSTRKPAMPTTGRRSTIRRSECPWITWKMPREPSTWWRCREAAKEPKWSPISSSRSRFDAFCFYLLVSCCQFSAWFFFIWNELCVDSFPKFSLIVYD